MQCNPVQTQCNAFKTNATESNAVPTKPSQAKPAKYTAIPYNIQAYAMQCNAMQCNPVQTQRNEDKSNAMHFDAIPPQPGSANEIQRKSIEYMTLLYPRHRNAMQ